MIDKEEERCYAVGLYHDGKFVGYFPTFHGYNVYCTSLDMNMVHVSTKEHTTQVCENFRSKYKDYIQFRFEVIDVRKDLFNESGSQSNSKDADKVDSSMSTPESKNNEMFSDMSHGQLYGIAVYKKSKFMGYVKRVCGYDADMTSISIKDAFVGSLKLVMDVRNVFIIKYAGDIGYVFDIINVDNILKTSNSSEETEDRKSSTGTKKESKVEMFNDMMKHMGYKRVDTRDGSGDESSKESHEDSSCKCNTDTDSLFNTEDVVDEIELGLDIYAHTYAECLLQCMVYNLQGNSELDYIRSQLEDVYDERLELEELFRCRFDGVSLYKYKY